MSERVNITNSVMQGTVWGSMLCTATMDKLGRLVYANSDLIYKYKGVVSTPSLGMVDDVLTVQKCSTDVVKMNAAVNAFMEGKKLKLSDTKCHRIHVNNKKSNVKAKCPELKIHNEKMNESSQEKYLGDIIDSSGTCRKTVEERRSKGFGIVAEILAILEDIPLGRYILQVGLMLRQAMLLNGILYNSESWHSVNEVELRILEQGDEHLLRALVKGHSKTPLEFLYLEAGVTPIRYVLASRRMMYHQVILQRDDSELTKRIYMAQKENTTPGDFVNLLKEDFKLINEIQNDLTIQMTNSISYKKQIKIKIKEAAFKQLKERQQTHSKVKFIIYEKLEIQEYMKSPKFSNEEVNLLHKLRSRTTDCKENFKQKYIHSNLLCDLCKNENENQQHIMKCSVILNEFKSNSLSIDKIEYEDIFSKNISKQKEITALYSHLFDTREEIVEKRNSQQMAPSPNSLELRINDNVPPCIVHLSSGK